MKNVMFVEVSSDNLKALLSLAVTPDQERYVGTVAEAIAESKFDKELHCVGIWSSDENQYVGFLMFRSDKPRKCVRLTRFLIGCRYQSRGYGTAALRAFEKVVFFDLCYPRTHYLLTLSVDRRNDNALKFYRRLGFSTDDPLRCCLSAPRVDDHAELWKLVTSRKDQMPMLAQFLDNEHRSLGFIPKVYSLVEFAAVSYFLRVMRLREFGRSCCLVHHLISECGVAPTLSSPPLWPPHAQSVIDCVLKTLWAVFDGMGNIDSFWFINKALFCESGASLSFSITSCATICVRGLCMRFSPATVAFIDQYRLRGVSVTPTFTDELCCMLRYRRINNTGDVFCQWVRHFVSRVCRLSDEKQPIDSTNYQIMWSDVVTFGRIKCRLNRTCYYTIRYSVQPLISGSHENIACHADWQLCSRSLVRQVTDSGS